MLHTRQFFADCKRALKEGGILVTQNGLPFLFPEHLKATTEIFASLFRAASPYMCTQPCYFGGPFALNAASDGEDLFGVSVGTLVKRMTKRGIETRYYTPIGHLAAFALPGYVEKIVAEAVGRPRKRAQSASEGSWAQTEAKVTRWRDRVLPRVIP